MTTVHTGKETVIRARRRPAGTATGAVQTRRVFGTLAVKDLAIPKFIDMYNHHMNGVDHADQLRGYYTSQRRSPHTWRPLWYFLLDTTVCNAYQLSAKCDPGAGRHRPHFAFTE